MPKNNEFSRLIERLSLLIETYERELRDFVLIEFVVEALSGLQYSKFAQLRIHRINQTSYFPMTAKPKGLKMVPPLFEYAVTRTISLANRDTPIEVYKDYIN